MDKYNTIVESLISRVESGELTLEEAENINDLAWQKYGSDVYEEKVNGKKIAIGAATTAGIGLAAYGINRAIKNRKQAETLDDEMGDQKQGILGKFQKKGSIDSKENPVNVENEDKKSKGKVNGTGDVAPKKSIKDVLKGARAKGEDEITSGTPGKKTIKERITDHFKKDTHFNDTETKESYELTYDEYVDVVESLNDLENHIIEAAEYDYIPECVAIAFIEAVETVLDEEVLTESAYYVDYEVIEAFIDTMDECYIEDLLTESDMDTLAALLDNDEFIASFASNF